MLVGWKGAAVGLIPSAVLDFAHRAYWTNKKMREAKHWREKCIDLQISMSEAYKRRDDYYRYINETVICNEPITYLEFGVFKGESISAWANLNSHSDSRFFGFDTFEGLPERWLGYEVGHFSVGGSPPSLDDKRTTFIKGLFQQTLPRFLSSFEPKGRLVIHMDADLFSATLFALTHLDRHIRLGSLILFDQFIPLDEYRAFRLYRDTAMKEAEPLVAMNDRFTKICFVMK